MNKERDSHNRENVKEKTEKFPKEFESVILRKIKKTEKLDFF